MKATPPTETGIATGKSVNASHSNTLGRPPLQRTPKRCTQLQALLHCLMLTKEALRGEPWKQRR